MVRWSVAVGSVVFGLIGWALIDITGLIVGAIGGAWIGLFLTGPLALRRSIERRLRRQTTEEDLPEPGIGPAASIVDEPSPADQPGPGSATLVCGSCRGTVPADARVCGYCGTPMG